MVLGGVDTSRQAARISCLGTVPDCIAQVRDVADPGSGITDQEGAVANPTGPEPRVDSARHGFPGPDRNVRELAGYVLRGMPARAGAFAPLQRAVEAGDGWLPPAIASIGTPRPYASW
jgi:hypothetical protein